MRAVNPSVTFGTRIAMALLVRMHLTALVCVATCRDDIEWSGQTFLGGKQTAAEPIRDQGGEVVGMQFQLSGVPTDYIAMALAEPIQGKLVEMFCAFFDPDTQAILDVIQVWTGTLDTMPISQGPETSSITVTAEHRGITFARPRGFRYTDADQQRLYPGDRSLEFIVSQSAHADTWPSAAFFRT